MVQALTSGGASLLESEMVDTLSPSPTTPDVTVVGGRGAGETRLLRSPAEEILTPLALLLAISTD